MTSVGMILKINPNPYNPKSLKGTEVRRMKETEEMNIWNFTGPFPSPCGGSGNGPGPGNPT